MEFSPKEFFLKQIEGKIRSYVAQGKESLHKVAKYIKTVSTKYGIPSQEIRQVITKVREETVEPFLNPKGIYRPERLRRFEDLCKELGFK